MCVRDLTVSMCVRDLTAYMCVRDLTVYMCVRDLTVYMCVRKVRLEGGVAFVARYEQESILQGKGLNGRTYWRQKRRCEHLRK